MPFEEVENLRKVRDEHIKKVQKLENEIELTKLKYRIESVARVLDYVNDLLWKKQGIPSNLIVHCLNKLHGNIDGVELTLETEEASHD